MDVSAVEDPVQRRALETMIKTYGQTPRQLFHTAHVNRPGSRLIMEGELPAAMGLLVQFAFRETREHTTEVKYPVCWCNSKVIQINVYQFNTFCYMMSILKGEKVLWGSDQAAT